MRCSRSNRPRQRPVSYEHAGCDEEVLAVLQFRRGEMIVGQADACGVFCLDRCGRLRNSDLFSAADDDGARHQPFEQHVFAVFQCDSPVDGSREGSASADGSVLQTFQREVALDGTGDIEVGTGFRENFLRFFQSAESGLHRPAVGRILSGLLHEIDFILFCRRGSALRHVCRGHRTEAGSRSFSGRRRLGLRRVFFHTS